MAEEKNVTIEQQKKELAELMWLNYFNQTLYEKGLITQTERNRMANNISRRKPSHRSQ